MICPNCSKEQSDAAECIQCALVLAKWKPRASPPVGVSSVAGRDWKIIRIALLSVIGIVAVAAYAKRMIPSPAAMIPTLPPVTDREAALEGYAAPTAEEQKTLDALISRIKALKAKNLFPVGCGDTDRQQPCSVDDALEAVEHEIVLQPVCGHEIILRSRLNRWNNDLPGNKEARGSGRPEALSYYRWYSLGYYEVEGSKDAQDAYVFSNRLHLNADYMRENESRSGEGRAKNLGAFYHQLLHAQFFIDAVKFDRAWQRQLCSDKDYVDLTPADADHLRISKLQEQFERSLVSAGL